MSSSRVSSTFGNLAFTDAVMQERLPRPTYRELSRVIQQGKPLNLDIANEVAHAMKEWALEKGATHYTHWFQPLTGLTSEKHDAFLQPKGDGTALMAFSGKELVQGEPDASSFPSGGLRATFEARGYTAWDPTSPAFIKDEVLCIPTAFISHNGQALDKKTPLLRSIVALEAQAKRMLKLFKREVEHVTITVGPEQEYFLIQEEDYKKRPDLILCGRTLFGCEPAKGQELEEHYFGAIRPTVNEFMKELDAELWALGIPAKTKHNEVAPCQHELASLYEQGSVAVDNNLLIMEKMRLLASRHGLSCLQHEKPFRYVNGSGKHDNWSISADGRNLLEPTSCPQENLQFLVVLASVIAAVDSYAELLRATVATAGNDHRLGGHEAPPAIISVFLGDDLTEIVDSLVDGKSYERQGKRIMDLGVPMLADVVRDVTDRNRTSPFAFTGNKFEFRMCGSQQNVSDPTMVLNCAVAEQFDKFASALEGTQDQDFNERCLLWIKESLREHRRVIFNGNGYSADWEKEAQERGLSNLKTTPSALPYYMDSKSMALFARYGVLDKEELYARYSAAGEQYAKIINIESNTMRYMTRHLYLPALFGYSAKLAKSVAYKQQIGVEAKSERELVQKLTDGIDAISQAVELLEEKSTEANKLEDLQERADYSEREVLAAMEKLRGLVDEMELICDHTWWPVPSYNKMLFYV